MCTGLEAAAIAAVVGTGATTYANYEQNQTRERETEAAYRNAAERQGELDDRRQQAFEQVVGETAGRGNTEDAMRAAAAAREAELNTASDLLPKDNGTYQQSPARQDAGSQVVAQAYQQQSQDNATENDARARALASLSGLGDALQNLQMRRQPYLDAIGANNSIARGAASLLPAELRAADRKADNTAQGWQLAGNVASSVGNAGLGYYGAKAGSGQTFTSGGGGYQAGRPYRTNTRVA